MVWQRLEWRGGPVLWVALAAFGLLSAAWAGLLTLTTFPGAGLLLVAALVGGTSAPRRAALIQSQQSHQSQD